MPDLIVPTLDISDVSVYYGHKCAVENVSFNAHSGHIYAIIGNNGCGKTSLMKAVMNLTGHNGICRLNGKTLEKMSVKKRARLISYIPQKTGINISMTVREVCLLGFNPHLRIFESYSSEGQKQLCILARTLIEDTPLLLLDEPDSALDFANRHMLMKHITHISRNNKCVIMCIHSPELALEYSDVIFLMKNGKIISDIDVHTADITEINEKMSFLYSNINVVECADANGRLHKTVLSL